MTRLCAVSFFRHGVFWQSSVCIWCGGSCTRVPMAFVFTAYVCYKAGKWAAVVCDEEDHTV
jgi:hypothetical protein